MIDSPLASYFEKCLLSSHDLTELNVEIIRNTLYKAWIEDFTEYCEQSTGEAGWEVMKEILEFEADRRTINITINSFGTEVSVCLCGLHAAVDQG